MRLTRFHGDGRALGTAIGRRFAAPIADALAENAVLNEVVLPFHRSARGRALYRELRRVHAQRYPRFVDELDGLAEGASVDPEILFLVNLRGEYRGYTGVDDGGECSTCAVRDDACAIIGHNEDGAAIYRGRSYLLHIEPREQPWFVVLCYPGFLPGNAFGFNAHGLCFSVNNVRPRQVEPGLGRHFLARSLFEASDIGSAIERLSRAPRAAGFNFTLGTLGERRIVNVEVAPRSIRIDEVRGWHFHANHYLRLDVAQHRFPSSVARQRRGERLLGELGAGDAATVRRVLRDRGDRELPIWRDGRPPDEGVTLLSALFDLGRARMQIFPGPLEADADRDRALVDLCMREP